MCCISRGERAASRSSATPARFPPAPSFTNARRVWTSIVMQQTLLANIPLNPPQDGPLLVRHHELREDGGIVAVERLQSSADEGKLPEGRVGGDHPPVVP